MQVWWDGFVGRGGSNKLESCYNTGEITASSGSVGGMIGYAGSVEINNCYNTGNISGVNAGGIMGYSYYGNPTLIINSYNTGTITASSYAGGILGTQNGVNALVYIKNSYNVGNVTGKYVGGIFNSGISIPTIENCYNIGALSGTSLEGGIVGYAMSAYYYIINGEILNCFYLNTVSSGYDYEMATRETTSLSKDEMYSQDLVDKLNTYIEDNGYEDEFYSWILGDDGYSTFK